MPKERWLTTEELAAKVNPKVRKWPCDFPDCYCDYEGECEVEDAIEEMNETEFELKVFFGCLIASIIVCVAIVLFSVYKERRAFVDEKMEMHKEYVMQGQRVCQDNRCYYYNGKTWERIYDVR